MFSNTRHVRYISIHEITRTDELQGRLALDLEVVKDYGEQMALGASFPPVLVYADDARMWLVDGYHRTAARERLGQPTVLAEVRDGTFDDAMWAACATNQTHGLRRSNADKRQAVCRALLHSKAQRLSDRQIAHHCGVHHHTVGRFRKELEEQGQLTSITTRNVTRGNSCYEQDVALIQRANAARHAIPAPSELVGPDPGKPCVAKASLTAAARNLAKAAERISTAGLAVDEPTYSQALVDLQQRVSGARREISALLSRLTDGIGGAPCRSTLTGRPSGSIGDGAEV